ncbi:MAG: hypothetical protein QGI83_24090 [Candidatus Latescibacteria bacterium]|nr:hypothetical protein [Candidatus Latescibacterota bacterium]
MARAPDQEALPLDGTDPLFGDEDLAAEMVAGIGRYLDRELSESPDRRARHWKRDFTSPEAYNGSIAPNREQLRRIVGASENREPSEITISTPALAESSELATGPGYRVYEVRWNVLKGLKGTGLLALPEVEPAASVLVLPDCDLSPEALLGITPELPPGAQYARRLVEAGCRVLVPVLIDRACTHSGIPAVRMTNQPHREFIYRAAYEVGRHVIGYEIDKVLAAVDTLSEIPQPVGVIGHGEGGLVALHAAALDTRIRAAAICGYIGPRETVWRQPIYRNTFGLLKSFGDAEILSMVAPRRAVVEACRHPDVPGPPEPTEGRGGAAPGVLVTPSLAEVQEEFDRARSLAQELDEPDALVFVDSGNGDGPPACDETLSRLLDGLGISTALPSPGVPPTLRRPLPDVAERHREQFHEMLEHTQLCVRESESRRVQYWAEVDDTSLEAWEESCQVYRDRLWRDLIGDLPGPTPESRPRTRRIYDTPKLTGYEVVLDVLPDVYASGILLVPSNIQEGERRPVVVCQHGLEGRPEWLTDPGRIDMSDRNDATYRRYACRLAQRGFVVYAPQNPYIGGDAFRVLQRKANPLGKSLYSFIVCQHQQTLRWLATLPFVDPERIAFYGLSYGGKTAMRVPAIVEGYCLSICSGDFNEWVWKNTSTRYQNSYLISGEYEMFEFNLANTFNYAEMSWLICARPFMVERGHADGVAPDEWVAYEFARTRRRYVQLGVGDRTEIEFFDGPHTINGQGTFDFLHWHLDFRGT